MFRYDSDLPSTPNARRSTSSNPSTTPAGPPPSFREPPSFTPSGPPPSQPFASSQLRSGAVRAPLSFGAAAGKNSFLAKATRGNHVQNDDFGNSFSNHKSRAFPSSPPQVIDILDDEDGDGEEEDYSADNLDEQMRDGSEEDESMFGLQKQRNQIEHSRFAKQSRDDAPLGLLDVAGFAKGLIAAQPSAQLHEKDDLIIGTEDVVERLEQISDLGEQDSSVSLSEISKDLRQLWAKHGKMSRNDVESDSAGPPRDASPIVKANFVASLLLQLYHPSTDDVAPPPPLFGRTSMVLRQPQQAAQMPKVLFDWLNQYHDPGYNLLGSVQENPDGYGAAPDFWDAVYANLFRGRFNVVIELLEGADFAELGQPGDDDGHPIPYSESQKKNIGMAMNQAISLLKSCPAVRDDNWDIKGQDWAAFRRRVSQSIERLRDFAEGEDEPDMGRSSRGSRLSRSERSRGPEARLPYDLFEPLTDMYTLLLGRPADLMKSAFSWLEGTIGLAAWWDGEEETAVKGSLAASRRSIMRSQQSRPADVTPALAYRQKLLECFAFALEEGGEPGELDDTFDTSDPVHIGIACILTGDVGSAIDIIGGWSITLASAAVEVGGFAGWLPNGRSSSGDVMNGLDDDDLMVLNYGQDDHSSMSKKDELLAKYADLLIGKTTVHGPDGTPVDGWVLALHLLSRFDAYEAADGKVAAILDAIPLDSSERVDKLLNLCNELDFEDQAVRLAEKYADSLLDSTSQARVSRFGDALLYYARGRSPAKMKEVLDMLTSLSLLRSLAYPPTADIDDRLQQFIEHPKDTLSELASTDMEAAQQLSTYLSGYANLRNFYDLRDAGVRSRGSTKRPKQSHATDDEALESIPEQTRKQLAAVCLLTAVSSASSSIQGSLYDPTTASSAVMPVNTLLALLGEVLPLLNSEAPRVLNLQQLYTLLRAVEDLQTVSPRIYAAADDFLLQTLANHTTGDAPSPRTMLRKSTSALTASSAFSMVGSSMLGSGETNGGTTASEDSMVLLREKGAKRGWDWRQGLRADAKGDTVLAILRESVAQEIARAFADGEDVRDA